MRSAADRALRGLHPDLIEISPEGAFTTIGQVREVVRQAASRPFEGARRVFILEADTLNVQAANASVEDAGGARGGDGLRVARRGLARVYCRRSPPAPRRCASIPCPWMK